MTHVRIENLRKQYEPNTAAAVEKFSLEIPSASLIALLGPSGSGKTTILKMLAGLITPTSGDIYFDDEQITSVPAEKRGAVMVFQNYLLFPYMSVGDNVGFGLKMRDVDKKTIRKRVDEMLELVKLPDVAKRRPSQLSGGQQQRVALARALITNPRLLLLDEPLSNLDAHLRDEMRELIRTIQRELQITTVFVTHDQSEAVLLADKIALLFDGVLHQYGAPREFYDTPNSTVTAQFFGGVNFIPAFCKDKTLTTAIGTFESVQDIPLDGDMLLTIRPEHVQLNVDNAVNTVIGFIQSCVYVGTYTRYRIIIGDVIIENTRTEALPDDFEDGHPISVHFPPKHIWAVPI